MKKIPVARLVAANQVPEVQMQPGMIDALDEVQGIQTLKDVHGAEAGKAVQEVRLKEPRICGHWSWQIQFILSLLSIMTLCP